MGKVWVEQHGGVRYARRVQPAAGERSSHSGAGKKPLYTSQTEQRSGSSERLKEERNTE